MICSANQTAPVAAYNAPAHAGVPKHHICNANLMKNGADFAVFLNTAQEFDGSDSGECASSASCWAVQVAGRCKLLDALRCLCPVAWYEGAATIAQGCPAHTSTPGLLSTPFFSQSFVGSHA